MPLLQENTTKRALLADQDQDKPHQPLMFQAQGIFSPFLMASQLMAATLNQGMFHPLMPLNWPPPSPPSPPSPVTSSEPLSPSHNNNNVDPTSKRRWKMEREEVSPTPSECGGAKEPNRERQFTCGVCNRSFGYKHVLQNHERTHTGEKPFECAECHKRFTRDHHLKTHMRLHTGERPYRCDHCDRQFVQVANLRRHLRVHTGEKPYQCERCAAKFSDSNQLKAHALIHTDEKPFACDRCRHKFRRRHHYLQHKCGTPITPEPDEPENLATLPEQTEPEDLSCKTRIATR